jgi:hypothetical protein
MLSGAMIHRRNEYRRVSTQIAAAAGTAGPSPQGQGENRRPDSAQRAMATLLDPFDDLTLAED